MRTSELRPAAELQPRMRAEITNLRFSPDGKLLLAQDGASIHIMEREPFRYLFRIPTLEATEAFFSGDSSRVFIPGNSRFETWSLSTRSRERIWEPSGGLLSCRDVIPSPDGKIVACLAGTLGSDIRLFDVETNTQIARHAIQLFRTRAITSGRERAEYAKEMVQAQFRRFLMLRGNPTAKVNGAFSPDGSTFVASSWLGSPCCESWVYRVDKREELSIGTPLRESLSGVFAFLGADRIAAADMREIKKGGLFSFPGGKRLSQFVLPPYPLRSAAHGDYLLVHQMPTVGAMAIDLNNSATIQSSPGRGFDRYDEISAVERFTGELALHKGSSPEAAAVLQIPESDLGRLRSGVHSADFRWVAFSGERRGQVWDLRTGKTMLTLPFDGGAISNQGVFTSTLESREKQQSGVEKKVFLRAVFDLTTGKETSSRRLPEKEERRYTRFVGPYEIEVAFPSEPKDKFVMEVMDNSSNQILWSHEMEEAPDWNAGNAIVIRYQPQSKGAERIISGDTELKKRFEVISDQRCVSLLEVLELATGKTIGHALDDSCAVSIARVMVAGKTLFVQDILRRTLAYSLESGARTGQRFGRLVTVDLAHGRVAVQNEPGKLAIYDGDMKSVSEFNLPGNVIYSAFDGAGKTLMGITGAQQVYFIEVP